MEEQIQKHIDKLFHYMKEEAYKPLTVQELEEALGIEDSAEFKEFVKALVKMEEKGLSSAREAIVMGLPEKMNLIRGKLTGHAKGFAFVTPMNQEWMIFLFRQMKQKKRCMAILLLSVFHRKVQDTKRRTVIRIIERGITEIVGTYSESKNFGFVIPDDKKLLDDIFIPKEVSMVRSKGIRSLYS